MLIDNSEITNEFSITQYNEVILTSVNRKSFDKVDSKSVFAEEYRGRFDTENTLHIIVGTDSGLLVNYLLAQTLPVGSRFLFVELQPVLDLLNVELPEQFKDLIEVINVDDFEQLITNSAYNLFFTKNSYKVHRSIAVKGNYLHSYSLLSLQVTKLTEFEYFEQKTNFTQKIFVQRQLQNLADNLQPASILSGAFKGKTAIVVGGGPSLDHHIDWLKQNKANLVILAASRVVGKLTRIGLSPDIVVSVDPQTANYQVNKDLMRLEHKALMIYSYHLESKILSQWRGGALFTGSNIPWLVDDRVKNIQSIGPTVTNSAIEVASAMGFAQVLLIGVDLCHSQRGETHTKDTYGANWGHEIGKMFEWVETYSGQMAETPIQLIHAIKSLEQEVPYYPNCRYINIAADAAKVTGVEYQPVEKIVLSPMTAELRQLLNSTNYHLSFAQKKPKLEQYLSQVTIAQRKLEKLIELLVKALNIIVKMTTSQEKAMVGLFTKLNKIESEINLHHSDLAKLSKFYGYHEFSQFLSSENVDNRSNKDIVASLHNYYLAFHIIAKELNQAMQVSLEHLQLRLDEGDENVNLTSVIERWHKHGQLGRSIIWRQEFPKRFEQLPESIKQSLAECEKAHVDDLDVPLTSNTQSPPHMGNAFRKLHLLNYGRDQRGLAKMVDYTQPFIDTSIDVLRLHYLAKSYSLAVQGDINHSLEAILMIPVESRLEVDLKQLVNLQIQLNQFNEACVNLKILCEFSDEYIPKYAKILSLMGQYQPALSAYIDYLNLYPKSIPVQLEVSQFLYQLGEVNYALQYVEQVLALDEVNVTALEYKKVMQSV